MNKLFVRRRVGVCKIKQQSTSQDVFEGFSRPANRWSLHQSTHDICFFSISQFYPVSMNVWKDEEDVRVHDNKSYDTVCAVQSF